MTPDTSDRLLMHVTLNTYSDLKRMASKRLSKNPLRRLVSRTSLVHESMLKLQRPVNLRDLAQRKQYFATMAYTMRSVLVDIARHKECENRHAIFACVSAEIFDEAHGSEEHYLKLDVALSRLNATEPDIGRVVHLRVFAGLQFAEIAEQLDISLRTAKRYWVYGKAWLKLEMDDED
jgi:RNA polymerase sigma factor (TIGR02999 family)